MRILYCREHLYSQISLKVWDSEEKWGFSSRLLLRHHIAWWDTFSIDPGILVSLYASAHHPYTTLTTGEWMIFWPREDIPLKLGQLSVAAILKSSHTCSCYQQPNIQGYNVIPQASPWEIHKHSQMYVHVCHTPWQPMVQLLHVLHVD